jgi:hypothetical protein
LVILLRNLKAIINRKSLLRVAFNKAWAIGLAVEWLPHEQLKQCIEIKLQIMVLNKRKIFSPHGRKVDKRTGSLY